MINKLSDPKWKERKEALNFVTQVITDAKYVQSSLGDLPTELKKRLKDTNTLLVRLIVTYFSRSVRAYELVNY